MAGNNRIQILRGRTVDIEACNEILLQGQPMYNLDTNQFYIGDGKSTVKQLYESGATVTKIVENELKSVENSIDEIRSSLTNVGKTLSRLELPDDDDEVSFIVETTYLNIDPNTGDYLLVPNRELPEGAFVDWGDGIRNNVYFHRYKQPGFYTIRFFNFKVIPENMFSYKDCIKAVRIKNCSVDDSAFEGNESLTEVSVDICPYIGPYAFSSCTSISYLNLGECKQIGPGAFNNCSSLDLIDIPYTVEEIGEGAFSGCSNVTHIYVDKGPKKIRKKAFDVKSDKLIDITLNTTPNQLTSDETLFEETTCPIVVDPLCYAEYTAHADIGNRAVSTCLTSYVDDTINSALDSINRLDKRVETLESTGLYQYTFMCTYKEPVNYAFELLLNWLDSGNIYSYFPQSRKRITFSILSPVDCPNIATYGTDISSYTSAGFKQIKNIIGTRTITVPATGSDKFTEEFTVIIEIIDKILTKVLGKIGGIVEEILDFLQVDEFLKFFSIVPTQEITNMVSIKSSSTTTITVSGQSEQYMHVTIPFTSINFPYYRSQTTDYSFGTGNKSNITCYKTKVF